VRSFEAFNANQDVQSAMRYCIDLELVRSSSAALLRALGGPDEGFCTSCTYLTACLQIYYPFFKDFGPLDLGLAFRFCRKTAQLLQVPPLAFHLVLWQIWLADLNFATGYCKFFGTSSSTQVPKNCFCHRAGGREPWKAPYLLHRSFPAVQSQCGSVGE